MMAEKMKGTEKKEPCEYFSQWPLKPPYSIIKYYFFRGCRHFRMSAAHLQREDYYAVSPR